MLLLRSMQHVKPGAAIGARVMAARKASGLSQEQVAVAADVTQSFISQIERGEIDDPGSMRLNRIAKAVGAELSALLEDEARTPRRRRVRRAV
jgi:transcriptional regulator with XRE-family HTH domain